MLVPSDQRILEAAFIAALGKFERVPVGRQEPQTPAPEAMRDNISVFRLVVPAPSGMTTAQRKEWSGYALYFAPSAVDLNASAAPMVAFVAFGDPVSTDLSAVNSGAVALRPGEGIRVPRGFTQVWLQVVPLTTSFGIVGDTRAEFIVERDPFVQWDGMRPVIVHTEPQDPLNVAGPSGNLISATAVNPVINTVLLDTGPLAAGGYEILAGWSSTAAAVGEAELQHRNAANAANNNSIRHVIDKTLRDVVRIPNIAVSLNERFRWLNNVAVAAGTVSTYIYYRRVA